MIEMKDSGVKWIGKIPSHWELKKVKEEYVFDTGFTPDTRQSSFYNDDDGYEWLSIGDLKGKVIPGESKTKISKTYVNLFHPKFIETGSLLYSFKLSVGQVAFTDRRIYSNEAIAAFRPNKGFLPFLYYSSSLIEYNGNFNIYGARILNSSIIKNSQLTFPPISEQKQIVKFLDKKCAEIDDITTNIQNQIDILENYKKSVITETVTKGLETKRECRIKTNWLGNMPIQWEISRLASMFKLRNVKVNDVDYSPLSVTMNGVVPQLENVAKSDAHEDRKLVCKGDFAINSRSDRRGSCGISSYNGSVSLINLVLIPTGNINSRYYNWLFHTDAFADEFYKWGHGIVNDLWTTNWRDMKNILIPHPLIEEQREIADYLDKKCAEIDDIIKIKEEQLATIEEYKKSLIYEYVTGKKAVVDD